MEVEDIILLGIMIILVIAIIVFNIISLIDYSKSIELNIRDTGVECTYNNLSEANKCIDDSDDLCSMPTKINYKLSQNPKSYIQVCNQICKLDAGAKTCEDDILQSRFDNCVQDLIPGKNCLNVERPLALDNEGNYLYAESIFN